MRLIDADRTQKCFDKIVKAYEKRGNEYGVMYLDSAARVIINGQPSIDAVPIVRFKNCKHKHSSEFSECRDPDAFCSDGEADDGK